MLNHQIGVSPKIHNFFDIECRDINTGVILQTAHAENIVLDHFYNSMIATNDTSKGIIHIAIGSNGDEPLKTDTNLKNTIGYGGSFTRDMSQVAVGGTGIITFTGTWVIDASTYVGQYIREVGARASQWGSGQTINRAILKDSNGNPLEILKTDTMVVTIYSTLYIVIPEYIDGFKYRPARYWGYNHDNGTISFLEPFSSIVLANSRMNKTWKENINIDTVMAEAATSIGTNYTADLPNKQRTFSLAAIQSNQANHPGGIRAIRLNGLEIPVPNNTFQQSVIVKEVVGNGDGVRTKFATEFGWIRDNGTLRVYINDVETFDFTPTFNKPPLNAKFLGFIKRPNMGGKTNVVEKIVPYALESHYLPGYDSTTLFGSNDGITWYDFGPISHTTPLNIPPEHQNYKYWAGKYLHDANVMTNRSVTTMSGGDIILNNPPPNGSVVTVTYQPDCIAKNDKKLIKNLSYQIGLDY